VTGEPSAPGLQDAAASALVIWAQAASVVLAGLLFVAAARGAGATVALAGWLQRLELAPGDKALLVVLGVGPALEALTGFGVSLLVTTPALLALLPPARALPAALMGMAIMPWGTLGLATLVGAELAELDAPALGTATAAVSALVPALAGGLALGFAGERRAWRALSPAALFALVLTAANATLGPELAGAVAGGAVAASLLARRRPAPPPRAIWPFAALPAAVILVYGLPLPQPTVAAGGVAFAPLATPAPALLLIATLTARRRLANVAVPALAAAWRPLATILLFVVMARTLVAGGALAALAGTTAAWGREAALVTVAAIGGLGGWLTGSGVAGNALGMADAVRLGAALDAELGFAAVQNAAAGHAAPGSVPIIGVLIAIAGAAGRHEERRLVRLGALWATANVALVLATALCWMR